MRHLLQVASFELTFHHSPLTSQLGQPLPQEALACKDSVTRTPLPPVKSLSGSQEGKGVLRGQGQMLRRCDRMEDGVVSSPCSKGIWTSWPSMATPPPCFSFTRLSCRADSRTVTERVQTASGSSAHWQGETQSDLTTAPTSPSTQPQL